MPIRPARAVPPALKPTIDDEDAVALASARVPSRAGAYEVGYKKPPKATRFKAGESGNPKGRPRHSKNFNTVVAEAMNERVSVRTAKGERRLSRLELMVMKAVEMASKGNMRAIQQLAIWFQQANPDPQPGADEQPDDAPLSPADEATLQAFRELVAAELSASDGEEV
jgi:hypothetical protein